MIYFTHAFYCILYCFMFSFWWICMLAKMLIIHFNNVVVSGYNYSYSMFFFFYRCIGVNMIFSFHSGPSEARTRDLQFMRLLLSNQLSYRPKWSICFLCGYPATPIKPRPQQVLNYENNVLVKHDCWGYWVRTSNSLMAKTSCATNTLNPIIKGAAAPCLHN